MATANDKELEDLLGKCSAWLPKAMDLVGCTATIVVTSTACKKAMKDMLSHVSITIPVFLPQNFEPQSAVPQKFSPSDYLPQSFLPQYLGSQ